MSQSRTPPGHDLGTKDHEKKDYYELAGAQGQLVLTDKQASGP